MLWLNDSREQIKKENPGCKVTDIAKIGGEKWRELKDKSIWEAKAAKEKERYENEMKAYKPPSDSSNKRKHESPSKKASTSVTMTGSGFKSKEYISEDESSSDDSSGKKKNKKKKKVIDEAINSHFNEHHLMHLITAKEGLRRR